MTDHSLEAAAAVTQHSSHAYTANFVDDWCIGTVPHGGYVTSTLLYVAALHFRTTLARQRQPDPLTVQLDFLRRTQAGPALFLVRDVKLGAQLSVIHITLVQSASGQPLTVPPDPRDAREEVVGYFTHTNLDVLDADGTPLPYTPTPPPPPVDLARLADNADPNWEYVPSPFPAFRKAGQKVQMHHPRAGMPAGATGDQWMRLRSGERWTTAKLGYAADAFYNVVDAHRAAQRAASPTDRAATASGWYPTVTLNLEFKKKLPPPGIEWLYSRVTSKQIAAGRSDLEVVIFDARGDLLALSHHVALILSSSRNLADRKSAGAKATAGTTDSVAKSKM